MSTMGNVLGADLNKKDKAEKICPYCQQAIITTKTNGYGGETEERCGCFGKGRGWDYIKEGGNK